MLCQLLRNHLFMLISCNKFQIHTLVTHIILGKLFFYANMFLKQTMTTLFLILYHSFSQSHLMLQCGPKHYYAKFREELTITCFQLEGGRQAL